MTLRNRFFLDTSATYYVLHGHLLMERAVADIVGKGSREVSKFIRMEYLRGMVIPMIELYFLIKKSESVREALIDWSQGFSPRRLKIVLMTITQWLNGEEGAQNKAATLLRLGAAIVRMVETFDRTFPIQHDPLSCELGQLSFPREVFHEEMLRNFKAEFDRIFAGTPTCDLCGFRQRQIQYLTTNGIELYSEKHRQKYKQNRGYVKQTERMEEAATTKDKQPSCRWCERLGDTIIMLHLPPEVVLVAVDRAFIPLTELLGKALHLLPSLVQLKRQLTEDS